MVDIDEKGEVVQRYEETLGAFYEVKGTYAGGYDAFNRFVEDYV